MSAISFSSSPPVCVPLPSGDGKIVPCVPLPGSNRNSHSRVGSLRLRGGMTGGTTTVASEKASTCAVAVSTPNVALATCSH